VAWDPVLGWAPASVLPAAGDPALGTKWDLHPDPHQVPVQERDRVLVVRPVPAQVLLSAEHPGWGLGKYGEGLAWGMGWDWDTDPERGPAAVGQGEKAEA